MPTEQPATPAEGTAEGRHGDRQRCSAGDGEVDGRQHHAIDRELDAAGDRLDPIIMETRWQRP